MPTPIEYNQIYDCRTNNLHSICTAAVKIVTANFQICSLAEHTMNRLQFHNLYNNSFYARQQNASRVLAIVWASVRPSSVTLVICIKTVQARITKSLLWAAPRCLVYRDKITCHWVQAFSLNEGVKDSYPLKSGYITAIISCSVKTVANRYRHAAYHNKH